MTLAIGLLLALILLALVLFSIEWVPADVVALGLMLAIILLGLLPADKAFAGFGSDTVLMTFGLLLMTATLVDTGVVDMAGRALSARGNVSPNTLLLLVLVVVSVLGAFISNTAAAAFFVPIVMGLAQRSKVSPSKLLMPLAFASILSSSVTLISTSTNLVVSGLMKNAGMPPMGMFELAPVGIPITILGIVYMFFIGRRLIPDRVSPGELIETFGVRSYLTEVLVLPDSKLAGKTLAESGLGAELDLSVLRVVRDNVETMMPRPNKVLRAGDVLLVEGPRERILEIKDKAGIEIKADVEFKDPNLRSEDTALVEALIPPASPLIGRSLRTAQFRDRYGLQVLGINRHGKNLLTRLARTTLRAGDVLLVQGHRQSISGLEQDRVLSVLGPLEGRRIDRSKALRAGIIFTAAIALGTFKVLSLPVAVLLGGFAMLATRCAAPEDAYRKIEWRVVILIACMLALGAAMDHTGAAKYVAGHVVGWVEGMQPVWLLTGFFFLTIALTQPMSNQAAAAVILPIALQTSVQMNLDPRPFAMMIAVAASCSYLTPLEPACLLVYGPGRYRFFDFFRVGAPLTLLIYLIAIVLVPLLWPLQPV